MAVPAITDWPTPDSLMLSEIVRAIRKRSKAFRKQVQRFDIRIEKDSSSSSDCERLSLSLESFRSSPERLTFAFWDDGVLWLDARQASKTGWQFEFSFYGNFNGVAPELLCDMVEQSLWINDREQMQRIWTRCEPYTN